MLNSERLVNEAVKSREIAENKAYNWTHSAKFELNAIAATLEMSAGLFAIAEAIKAHSGVQHVVSYPPDGPL